MIVKKLAAKAELKAEQDKLVKLQTYDLSLFIGQRYFNNIWAQLSLIHQPVYYTLKVGDTEVALWKSKGLPTEKLITPTATDHSLSTSIKWSENSNFCLIFKKSYLKKIVLLQMY